MLLYNTLASYMTFGQLNGMFIKYKRSPKQTEIKSGKAVFMTVASCGQTLVKVCIYVYTSNFNSDLYLVCCCGQI